MPCVRALLLLLLLLFGRGCGEEGVVATEGDAADDAGMALRARGTAEPFPGEALSPWTLSLCVFLEEERGGVKGRANLLVSSGFGEGPLGSALFLETRDPLPDPRRDQVVCVGDRDGTTTTTTTTGIRFA
jgi:hypothetical protein